MIKINMDVSDKAKRIMVSAVEKLKHSRAQRGGLRLHRTLLLTLAIRSARDLFDAAQMLMETQVRAEPSAAPSDHPVSPSSAGEALVSYPRDPSCGASNEGNRHVSSFVQPHRKRRAKATTEPDFLPCKKARVERDTGTQQPPASPG
ncbi:immediate early response gene 2 protein [Takifugu flavidus]|nr:immediate early response gene 2 protein [Takifugu flavidus]